MYSARYSAPLPPRPKPPTSSQAHLPNPAHNAAAASPDTPASRNRQTSSVPGSRASQRYLHFQLQLLATMHALLLF